MNLLVICPEFKASYTCLLQDGWWFKWIALFAWWAKNFNDLFNGCVGNHLNEKSVYQFDLFPESLTTAQFRFLCNLENLNYMSHLTFWIFFCDLTRWEQNKTDTPERHIIVFWLALTLKALPFFSQSNSLMHLHTLQRLILDPGLALV